MNSMSRRRLINLPQTFKHTKMIATHDLDFAMELCEYTIVIYKGSVTADGPTGNIFNDEELLKRSNLKKPASLLYS